jgi:hypothetical protein
MTSEVVEHASVFHADLRRDVEIRSRARNAPLWMKQRIDADRQRRGMRPLWASNDQTRRRASAKARALGAFVTAARLQAGLSGS